MKRRSSLLCCGLLIFSAALATPHAQAVAPVTAAQTALPRIGYDAFKVDFDTIKPGPVDGTYVFSPGDVVHLRVWGELQLSHQLTVSPDLYLEVPDVPGRVYIGDLPLTDVKDRVRRHLATAYDTYFDLDNPAASAAFVDLALGEVRDLQFLVQGEVTTPGSYSLHPSLGTLIYGIARAGGIKDSGSLRNIRIRRAGRTINIDFYDFLMNGTMDDAQLRLRNGDVIFVPLKRREVTIQGEVRRPGIYALHEQSAEDLETLLEFAGGVLSTASTDRLLIRRTVPNEGPRTLTINLNAERAAKRRVPLLDADIVTLVATNSDRRDYVVLGGNGVPVPGEYQFSPGMRVTDLLKAAGGLMPDAYRERADLRRTGVDMRTTYSQVNLRRALEGDATQNVLIEALDELVVYSVRDIEGLDGVVTLKGHVKAPGEVPLSRGMRVYDLLFSRAGLQDTAFMRDTYLPRADLIRVAPGATAKQLVTFDLGKLLEGDPAQNLELRADDEVIVYTRAELLGSARHVTLSGYARQPGEHPLLQGMTLRDLLKSTAGGFEDPDFRRDAYLPRGEVWRRKGLGDQIDRELIRFDLGAVLNGDEASNIPLQSGDEVVLFAAEAFREPRTVEVAGAVNKPGSYPLASNMTLGDLLIQAGGLKDLADTQSADLFRIALSGSSDVALETVPVSLADLSLPLRNKDRLLVKMRAGYQPSRVVTVTGQVQYPGPYTLGAGGRVADVIRMAGGLVDGAFVEGAALRRGGATRIVFDLERALEHASSTDNLLLEHGDELAIPRRADTVTVVDEVEQPITITFSPGKGVDYYLRAAGGLTAEADPESVSVILPSGRHAASRFLRGPEILPGSTITVAKRPVPPALLAVAAASSAVGGPVAAQGPVSSLAGACPALSFALGTMRVSTLDTTTFIGVTCATLSAGDVIELTATRISDRVVVATEIRKR